MLCMERTGISLFRSTIRAMVWKQIDLAYLRRCIEAYGIDADNALSNMKGVQDMIDYEARTQARVDEAILLIAKNAVDNYYKTHKEQGYAKIIDLIANLLSLDEKTITTLRKEYKVQWYWHTILLFKDTKVKWIWQQLNTVKKPLTAKAGDEYIETGSTTVKCPKYNQVPNIDINLYLSEQYNNKGETQCMIAEVEIGVQLLEWFKELSGFSNKEFLDYMNKNNAWDLLNNTSLVKGCMWAEEEDIINIFGKFLTQDERLSMLEHCKHINN